MNAGRVWEFDVCGKVRGQGRPRFAGNGHAYKAAADRAWEQRIRLAFEGKYGTVEPSDNPFSVYVTTFRALPGSTPKRVEASADTVKPDADNVLKSVLDALTGVVWKDDSQVISATAVKASRMRRKEHMRVFISETTTKGGNDGD